MATDTGHRSFTLSTQPNPSKRRRRFDVAAAPPPNREREFRSRRGRREVRTRQIIAGKGGGRAGGRKCFLNYALTRVYVYARARSTRVFVGYRPDHRGHRPGPGSAIFSRKTRRRRVPIIPPPPVRTRGAAACFPAGAALVKCRSCSRPRRVPVLAGCAALLLKTTEATAGGGTHSTSVFFVSLLRADRSDRVDPGFLDKPTSGGWGTGTRFDRLSYPTADSRRRRRRFIFIPPRAARVLAKTAFRAYEPSGGPPKGAIAPRAAK